jgi:uncharacterized protein (TIGR02646 family)
VIRLNLGPEPNALTAERERRLPGAITKWNAWKASSAAPDKEVFLASITGYRVAVDALHVLQGGKCAYCERATGRAGSPTEHIRPKNGVEVECTAAPGRDPERYWWLAWDWHNLVFACATCNCQANKGNRFPLEPGSPVVAGPTSPAAYPLPDSAFDTAVERRLFVHPREDDPLEHLEWAPTNRADPVRLWRLSVSGRSTKGERTIDVLDLTAAIEDIQTYLTVAVWPWIEEIESARSARNGDKVRTTWSGLCSRVLGDVRVPFRGPIYWAMKHAWNKLGLSQWGCAAPPAPSVQP